MNISINTASLTVLGIPPYLFWAEAGYVVSLSFFIMACAMKGKPYKRYGIIFNLSLCFLAIGAKIGGIILKLITVLVHHQEISVTTFTETGIVFYGGLVGFLVSFVIMAKFSTHEEDRDVMDILACSIPLFRVFGRIGCFSAGCCFGIETDCILSVEYTNYVSGELVTANRFPVQLAESMVNGIIFVALLSLLYKNFLRDRLIYLYLIIYSCCRFVLEFFRGDFDREVFGVLSFSQIISVILFSFGSIWLGFNYIRKRKVRV